MEQSAETGVRKALKALNKSQLTFLSCFLTSGFGQVGSKNYTATVSAEKPRRVARRFGASSSGPKGSATSEPFGKASS